MCVCVCVCVGTSWGILHLTLSMLCSVYLSVPVSLVSAQEGTSKFATLEINPKRAQKRQQPRHLVRRQGGQERGQERGHGGPGRGGRGGAGGPQSRPSTEQP